MARLFANPPHEIANRNGLGGRIEPRGPGTSSAAVELWHRSFEFNQPLGPYELVDVFDEATDITPAILGGLPLRTGGLYQARIFRPGTGTEAGEGTSAGPKVFGPLGRLDMPVLNPELRSDLLTRCTEGEPQVKIDPGGTYVGFTIAGAAKTCLRVQFGSEEPHISELGLPAFKPEHLVATGLSLDPGFVHTLDVTDILTQTDTHGHTPLGAGQELWFVALAWTETEWDWVWGTEGRAPGSPHNTTSLTTEHRTAVVALETLYCDDDSDDLSDGEADFTLRVTGPGVDESASLRWSPMESGTSLDVSGVSILIPDAPARLSATVTCNEDDAPAADDIADTRAFTIPMPVGRVTEDVRNRHEELRSRTVSGTGELRFRADLRFQVLYT
jgi:hypothetical protein